VVQLLVVVCQGGGCGQRWCCFDDVSWRVEHMELFPAPQRAWPRLLPTTLDDQCFWPADYIGNFVRRGGGSEGCAASLGSIRGGLRCLG
jgi:hypothetical protein